MILRTVWLLLLLTVSPAVMFGQANDAPEVFLDEADANTQRYLQQAREFFAHKQWEEGVDRLRSVMESDPNQVVQVASRKAGIDDEFSVFLPVRQYCFMQLAALHETAPNALELYRRQVDSLASQWLRQAIEEKDERLLVRVVEQAFLSGAGDEALLRLGDWELEQGRWTSARGYWERISPTLRAPLALREPLNAAGECSWWLALRGVNIERHWQELAPLLRERRLPESYLAYPDADVDLAGVWARLALASALEGNLERAQLEASILRRLYPDAQGYLAGRQGKYADLIDEVLQQSKDWPPESRSSGWPTFAGSPARQHEQPVGVDIGGRPLWSRRLPRLTSAEGQPPRPRVAESASGLLSVHPIVQDGIVYYCDLERIYATRLATGEPALPGLQADEQSAKIYGPDELPQWADSLLIDGKHLGAPRFTMTIHRNKLYARLGWPQTSFSESDAFLNQQPSRLVGLDTRTFKLLHPPIEPDNPRWTFEGAPLVDDSNVYVAMRRNESRIQSFVACYNGRTGRLKWRRKICTSQPPDGGRLREFSHNLLTLHEGVIYYNTNRGVTAALGSRAGEVRWIARYPRSPLRAASYETSLHYFRDLTPCLAHRSMVIAAPSDSDRLFSLDASTGTMLWSTPSEGAVDAVHLLGVGSDNLVASGAYLYWIDVHTGRFVGHFPHNGGLGPDAARPTPRGYGRGMLAGGLVWWPTRDKIYLFHQRTERSGGAFRVVPAGEIALSHRGRGVTGGNLVMVDGVMLLATADRLIAFSE